MKIQKIILIGCIISLLFLSIVLVACTQPLAGQATYNELSSIQKQKYWKCFNDNKCNDLLKNKDSVGYRKCSLDCNKKASEEEKAYCIDTDGDNYLTIGKVTTDLYKEGKEDYCYTFDSNKIYLMEGKCVNNAYQYTQKNCAELGNYECKDGACVEKVSYCCIDNALKIGYYSEKGCVGDENNLEQFNVKDIDSCKEIVKKLKMPDSWFKNKEYRFASYYYTTPDFALVCTEPCSIKDINFFQASFEGHILGVKALKDRVGYLPKKKMEFHVGKDRDCFVDGYDYSPPGYHSIISTEGNEIICNSDYWWYTQYKGTNEEVGSIDYYKNIKSQTLTIHEPIHLIFFDYAQSYAKKPEGKIQEAFCKGISLAAVGIVTGYGDNWFVIDGSSIDNPPKEGTAENLNFFTYSLNKRYGFNEDSNTKEFFKKYKEMEDDPMDGNLKVKLILDQILKTDTTQSFKDVGIDVTNLK